MVSRFQFLRYDISDETLSQIVSRFTYTYIIGHYNPSVRITAYVVWVNFTSGWPNLQFKADSERQIFEKLFHGDFSLNFTQSFCQNSAERKSPKIYSFHSFFVLISNCGLVSNKPTHYLLNYGDFRQIASLFTV